MWPGYIRRQSLSFIAKGLSTHPPSDNRRQVPKHKFQLTMAWESNCSLINSLEYTLQAVS